MTEYGRTSTGGIRNFTCPFPSGRIPQRVTVPSRLPCPLLRPRIPGEHAYYVLVERREPRGRIRNYSFPLLFAALKTSGWLCRPQSSPLTTATNSNQGAGAPRPRIAHLGPVCSGAVRTLIKTILNEDEPRRPGGETSVAYTCATLRTT